MRSSRITIGLMGLLLCVCGVAGEPEATADGLTASDAILGREPATEKAEVLHVLIGWDALAPNYGGRMDESAKQRSKADADALAADVLTRARKDEDFPALMQEFSEDWASAEKGTSYTATPDAQLVPPFKALSLRLEPGEVGIVETNYGWHVIKRIE